MPTIVEEYVKKHPKAAALFKQSAETFPDGVTHDTRYMTPFPLYITEARGGLKWDVDGFEYVDYVSGHGALILGHSHQAIVKVVQDQMAKGTHLGANTEYELRWGKAIKALMPSVEKIRFHSSGTEATLMAMRMARAYTGKNKIVKFQDHFHGWHDYAMAGGDGSPGGIPASTWESMAVVPSGDLQALDRLLSKDKDVAGVISEPTGPHMGQYPLKNPDYLKSLREITQKHGVVMILDEVVTGFRLSKGGAQVKYGITPDLTTMAKIVAGGLPGGAVGGKADIIDMIQHRGDAAFDNKRRVAHNGTFNANPLSAVAGYTALEMLAKEPINARADATAAELRKGLNEVFSKMEVPGVAHGVSSLVLIAFGVESDPEEVWKVSSEKLHHGAKAGALPNFKKSMINNGVDIMGGRGFIVSAVHTKKDVEKTVGAFEKTLSAMRKENLV
ncbi:MAG: aminotransferase class III-fold pyridoxal phosphate-dependent enzyme [SAR202 cluster bacterium]|nr:aminotransferase class III-fold pyridoxal phosphate-dependent enzyme [SAR202 cluster bacterium]